MATIKCSVCGSNDVQLRAWIKPNENNECTHPEDFAKVISKPEDCYCCDCGDNVTLISEEDTNG